jgi:hypothetical protein
MLKITRKTHVLSLAVFAALAIVPMAARADDGDGGGGGEYDFPAANVQQPRTENVAAENVTCVQATKAAWFQHELELSDGDVTPAMDTPRECQREIYATADMATE